MNISICTLLPFLFDLVLMHRRLHRGTSGKDRDMALDETENRTNEASDLSQKNYISLPILMCAFFHKTHHGELRSTYCQLISVYVFLVYFWYMQFFVRPSLSAFIVVLLKIKIYCGTQTRFITNIAPCRANNISSTRGN